MKGLRVGVVSLALGLTVLAQSPNSSKPKSSQNQTTSSSSSSSSESEGRKLPRFWVGLSGSYTPFRLVSVSTSTNSTTGESVSSMAANGQVGGGVNLNLRVFGNFWVNAGGVYRFGGYDTNDYINNTAGNVYIQRTRARLLDFPLLVRYADSRFRWNKYSFYELGGAVRYATSIKTTNAAVNGEGTYFCCAPASTTQVRRMIEGVVVGTGVVGKDDFGIKVAPEVRYVRWMGDTFRAPTLVSQRDQLEVVITFGF